MVTGTYSSGSSSAEMKPLSLKFVSASCNHLLSIYCTLVVVQGCNVQLLTNHTTVQLANRTCYKLLTTQAFSSNSYCNQMKQQGQSCTDQCKADQRRSTRLWQCSAFSLSPWHVKKVPETHVCTTPVEAGRHTLLLSSPDPPSCACAADCRRWRHRV